MYIIFSPFPLSATNITRYTMANSKSNIYPVQLQGAERDFITKLKHKSVDIIIKQNVIITGSYNSTF